MYFYTATIHQWKPLIREHNFESIILDSLSFLYRKECIKVYGFVIMPNHIHMIWEMLQNNGKESPAASLMKFTAHKFEEHLQKYNPAILNSYSVKWQSRKYNFWQPKADWFLLYNEITLLQKLNYIHNNPLQEKWMLVTEPALYPFSSASFYEGGENKFDFLHDYREYTG